MSPKSDNGTFQALGTWSGHSIYVPRVLGHLRPFTRSVRVLQLVLSSNGSSEDTGSLSRRRRPEASSSQEVSDASDQPELRYTLRIDKTAFA